MSSRCFLFLLLFSFPVLLFPSSKADLSYRFQKALEEEDGEKAESVLERLSRRVIPPGRLDYNRGLLQYQKGDLESAAESFAEAEEELRRSSFKARSAFNRGNSLYEKSRMEQGEARLGSMKQALEAYQDALHWDPSMEDASYNLEWIQQEVEKQEQQNKQNQKENQDQNHKDQQKDPEGDSQESQEQNDQNTRDNSEPSENIENSPTEQRIEEILKEEEERKQAEVNTGGGNYNVDQDW